MTRVNLIILLTWGTIIALGVLAIDWIVRQHTGRRGLRELPELDELPELPELREM